MDGFTFLSAADGVVRDVFVCFDKVVDIPGSPGDSAFFADCPLPPFAGGFSAGFQRAYPRGVSVSFLRRQVRQRAMRKCI